MSLNSTPHTPGKAPSVPGPSGFPAPLKPRRRFPRVAAALDRIAPMVPPQHHWAGPSELDRRDGK